MARFIMDILRSGFTAVRDKKEIVALNDARASAEATTIFATGFADDPDVTGYRLRETRRRRCRLVREVRASARP